MLRIGICDDEERARDALRFELEKILIEGNEEIVYEFSSGQSAVRWLKSHPGEIDLLFFDVEMNGVSGMEAARLIREFDSNIILVFATGYSDYVFDGYRVQALDYLLKPVSLERITEVMERVRRSLNTCLEEQLVFRNPEGMYRIYRSDILYCSSEKRKVSIVLKDKTLSLYAKLDEIQEKLGDKFIRIHQRYLVNADAVGQIGKASLFVNGEELPISRAMKNEVMDKLARELLEEA